LTHSTFDDLAFLEAASGAKLSYRHLTAQSAPKAVLLINHGLVEHSGRYKRFAEFMAENGYHIYAHDHRGHGHTTSHDGFVGRFARHDGGEKVISDVKAMRDFAASQHPSLPIIVFGHSMGALIAMNYAVSYPADYQALAIYNFNFNQGVIGRVAQAALRISQFFKGSDVPSVLMIKASFEHWNKTHGDGRTRADWLSHDQGVVDAYLRDPLCQFEPSTSLWQDVFKLSYRAPKLFSRLRDDLPVLLVGGTQDPATHEGKAMTWLKETLRSNGSSNSTLIVYDGFRHETLNEVNYMRAQNDFLAWADGAICGKTA
jgi:alpha-beta hydrolase superfamily lysophospholipase